VSGEAVVRGAQFTKHEGAAAQVGGKLVVDRCRFSQEVAGAIVSEGGQLRITTSEFEKNRVHLEGFPQSGIIAKECVFLDAAGDCAVHVTEGTASFSECDFQRNPIAIVSEGDVSVTKSTFSNSRNFAFLFNGKAKGEIRESEFIENGECAFHCIGGTPSIIQNVIKGHRRFGVYIFKGARPAVEGNEFESNGLASVWRE
jgi:hypothetical protein